MKYCQGFQELKKLQATFPSASLLHAGPFLDPVLILFLSNADTSCSSPQGTRGMPIQGVSSNSQPPEPTTVSLRCLGAQIHGLWPCTWCCLTVPSARVASLVHTSQQTSRQSPSSTDASCWTWESSPCSLRQEPIPTKTFWNSLLFEVKGSCE